MALGFEIKTFDKLRGINSKKALTQKSYFEAEDARGGYFDKFGSFVKRRGGSKYNTTETGSKILGGFDFQYGSLTQTVIISGTDIYTGSAGTLTSIYSSLTTDLVPDFATFFVVDDLFTFSKDFLFITNGKDAVLKYDASAITNAGIERPAAAPTLNSSSAVGGSLTDGVYLVSYTYVSADGVESNPSDELEVTLSAGGSTQSFVIDIVNSADTQTTIRRIYMTSVGGASLFENTTSTVNDNTTVTADITTSPDGALLEYDHDVPPLAFYIETGRDRVFAARTSTNPNRFFFSKQYKPFYFPQGELDQENLFYFDVGDGRPITGIKSFYDSILIFKEEDIYILMGNDEFSYRLEKVKSDYVVGCSSNQSIAIFDNWCYFVDQSGYYRTNGVVIQKVSGPLDDFFSQFPNTDEFQVNKQTLNGICAIVDRDLNNLILAVPVNGETENNAIFCMGLDDIAVDEAGGLNPNWNVWPDVNCSCLFYTRSNGQLKWNRGEYNGFIYEMNQIDGEGGEVTTEAGDITASTSTTITLDPLSYNFTVDIFKNVLFRVTSGTGKGDTYEITSNTANVLTFTPALLNTPDSTTVISIGFIEFKYKHAWNDYGQPTLSKRWRFVRPRFDTTGNFPIGFTFGYDFSEADNDEQSENLSSQSLWDVSLWDVAIWDGQFVTQTKYSIPSSRIHRWSTFSVQNDNSAQPITYNGTDKVFQMKGIR